MTVTNQSLQENCGGILRNPPVVKVAVHLRVKSMVP
jgi:hypothetical protein